MKQALVFRTYPQSAIIPRTKLPYPSSHVAQVLPRIVFLKIRVRIRIVIHSAKIRAYPHASFTVFTHAVNGIVGKCIPLIRLRHGQMYIFIGGHLVDKQSLFRTDPQVRIRPETNAAHIFVQQFPDLTSRQVYLHQPLGRTYIQIIMQSLRAGIDDHPFEIFFSICIPECLKRDVIFRIVQVVFITAHPQLAAFKPEMRHVGGSRLPTGNASLQVLFLFLVAEQSLIVGRNPDISVRIEGNPGD